MQARYMLMRHVCMSVCLSVCLCVCPSVTLVCCIKMADPSSATLCRKMTQLTGMCRSLKNALIRRTSQLFSNASPQTHKVETICDSEYYVALYRKPYKMYCGMLIGSQWLIVVYITVSLLITGRSSKLVETSTLNQYVEKYSEREVLGECYYNSVYIVFDR